MNRVIFRHLDGQGPGHVRRATGNVRPSHSPYSQPQPAPHLNVRRVPIPATEAVLTTLVEPGRGPIEDLRSSVDGDQASTSVRISKFTADSQVYRKLFPDPGLLIRASFGSVASDVWSQLRAPNRLAPSDHLDVLVQVYQVFLPVTVSTLEQLESRSFGEPFELRPLMPEKARAIGVTLPSLLPDALPTDLPLRVAETGQYLWAARLVSDPTAHRRDKKAKTN